jgi:outer membrane lipoprotein SlyB
MRFWPALLLLLAGCASKPQLYPNQKYKESGEKAAQADIDACMDEADRFLKSPRGKKIARGAGTGAVVGGAFGAALGLFSGNVVRGAAIGAGVGAAGGAASGAMSPDEVRYRYVNKCLADKGYEVLGWD